MAVEPTAFTRVDRLRNIRYRERITRMQQNSRSASPERKVRTPDALTRDAGKVQVGGYIKKLPVAPADKATRDARKVQVGGYIKKLPVTPFDKATRDAGKVQVGGYIKKLPKG
jgi:hypothetical protein